MHMMNKEKYKRLRESVNMGLNKECERISECPKEMTNDEYRERIIDIFIKMEGSDKLRFWYKYISAIENGED